eukprot:GFYU01000197.1.p1 GENE.GFYU01000197.1~~GFYU01000197.1.p1  ORF type:complete len:433 (-),score=90.78 GFYU01000197.1:109-1215(-)
MTSNRNYDSDWYDEETWTGWAYKRASNYASWSYSTIGYYTGDYYRWAANTWGTALENAGNALVGTAGSHPIFSCYFHNGVLYNGAFPSNAQAWDIETGARLTKYMGHKYQVNSVFAVEEHLYTAANDEVINGYPLGDPSTRGDSVEVDPDLTLVGHKGPVRDIHAVVGARGHQIYSASNDGTAKLWDVNEEKCVRTFHGHTGGVYAIRCWSDDCFATGSGDHSVKIWDQRKKGAALKTMKVHEGPVMCVKFDDDGSLYTASLDGSAKELDMRSEKITGGFKHQDGWLYAVAIHDAELYTGGTDSVIKVWDLSEGSNDFPEEPLREYIGHNSWVYDIDVHDDKVITCSKDGTTKVWDLESGDLYTTVYH